MPFASESPQLEQLVSRACRTRGWHVEVAAPDEAGLLAQLAPFTPDAGVTNAIRSALLQVRASLLEGPRRILAERLEARAAPVAWVDLHVCGTGARFWSVGRPGHMAGESLEVRHPVLGPPMRYRRVLGVLVAIGTCASLSHPDWSAVFILWLWWSWLAGTVQQQARWRLLTGHVADPLRYLLAGRPAPAMPPTVLAGPDERASALFYSLFAHLASLAGVELPGCGGTLLGGHYEELQRILWESGYSPALSSTYRIDFGPTVAPRRVRFVHLATPAGEPGVLHQWGLVHASDVWLVLPEAAGPESDHLAARLVAQSGVAHVTLILYGPGNTLSRWPATARALAGRQHRAIALDLASLRTRYLSGQVTPEEAGEVVQLLVGGKAPQAGGQEAAPPTPEAGKAPHRPAGRERA